MKSLPVALFLLAGCAASGPALAPATASNGAALDRAVEAFYKAQKPEDLRKAVDEARQAGPDTGAYHEIAAELAELDDRRADEFQHLSAALADTSDPGALRNVHRIHDLPLTTEAQKDQLNLLLGRLWRVHPDARVRAVAAYFWVREMWDRGRSSAPDEVAQALTGVLPLSLVGGWDNDQGKGFETAFPPEEGVDLAARYQGSVVEIGWRPALAPPWHLVGIGSQAVPRRAAVAYVASGVQVPAAGRYEVRLTTGDPLKLWVDGELRLSMQEVKDFSFDGFVVPVDLTAGAHQILVKCAQSTGLFSILVRVTGPDGTAVQGLAPLPAGRKGPASTTTAVPLQQLVEAHVKDLPQGSARRAFHELYWTSEMVEGREAVRRAEQVASAFPSSLQARFHLAGALWDEEERGRAADLITDLDRTAGEEFPKLALWQGRMWRQQGLARKARAKLEASVKAHPDRFGAYMDLEKVYKGDGWQEDRCRLLQQAVDRWPGLDEAREQLEGCRADLGLSQEWDEIQQAMLDEEPWNATRILARVDTLVSRGRIEEALGLTQALERERSDNTWAPWEAGLLLRRLGRLEEAKAAYLKALAMDPDDASIHAELASLAYVQGDTARAISGWKDALARNPKNQQLANRLTELTPVADGDWAADVPDATALEAAVEIARKTKPLPGADVLVALDDEVRSIGADGSQSSVVTQVRRAATQNGVDRLLQESLGSGLNRVIVAYALDPEGKRIEPSTVESSRIIFRGLQVGSVVAVQYRSDRPPSSVLESSVEGSWWFEAYDTQVLKARLSLWRPATRILKENLHGRVHVDRQETVNAKQIRVVYAAHDTPPVVQEEQTPPTWDVLTRLHFSTLPDWETFTRWEKVLLDDALRPSTDVSALAPTLSSREAPVTERLEKIQRYLMQNVRYQQDYENPIAGWKPHPTAMVLERKYGDCKDKANLFIMLARELGVTAHFALVRTRGQGEVDKDVPGLQFNHAIVEVPVQPGLAVARFFDPTADALDLQALPEGDQGTLSLVYDEASGKNEWISIPFLDPALQVTDLDLDVALKADGSATGQLVLSARGDAASYWRRTARNPESLLQVLKSIVPRIVPGASVTAARATQVDDLKGPAVMTIDLEIPHLARPEGNGLRMAGAGVRPPALVPSLPTRQFPLYMGTPKGTHFKVSVKPPEGWTVRSSPSASDMPGACIAVHRRAAVEKGTLVWKADFEQTCEKVQPDAYPAFRSFVTSAVQMLDDPTVLTPKHR